MGCTDHVGFDGEQRISTIDFSLIVGLRISGSKRKLLEMSVGLWYEGIWVYGFD